MSYSVTISPTGGLVGQVSQPEGERTAKRRQRQLHTKPGHPLLSNLSVTTSASTPAGTYTLTITGASGTLTHTTT
jgi:hypothetical protein